MKFVNRVGEHLNRRKLKILKQTAEELIVDIEHFDEGVSVGGTPINAQLFETWEERVAAVEKLATPPDCAEVDRTGLAEVSITDGRFVFKNLKGVQGERGFQGVPGIQGMTGIQGHQGIIGEKGAQGIQGAQGEKGERGIGAVCANMHSAYCLYVRADGVLCVGYEENTQRPNFVLQDGKLKYVLV